MKKEILNWLKFFQEIDVENLNLKKNLKKEKLWELEKDVLNCKACPLHEVKINYVFGEGNPGAEILFVGEAPGEDEDIQGRPFVGEAGKLLTKIIEGMKFNRDDVYIANVLKCRPPNNRNPKAPEIEQCKKYLIKQIEIINPKVIIALGKIASSTLSGENISILSRRGEILYFKNIPLIPTFHPAFILRNRHQEKMLKKLVWKDIKTALKIINRV
ncbi:MAG: uracil-DNA glycosylase [Acidobacteriota bacterium]